MVLSLISSATKPSQNAQRFRSADDRLLDRTKPLFHSFLIARAGLDQSECQLVFYLARGILGAVRVFLSCHFEQGCCYFEQTCFSKYIYRTLRVIYE